jgi:D-aminopeptidase
MAGTPYLVDSNVLLRWVKPDDRDYPLVVSAIDATLQCASKPRMAFNNATQAELVSYLPNSMRVDAYTIRFTVGNMAEASRLLTVVDSISNFSHE